MDKSVLYIIISRAKRCTCCPGEAKGKRGGAATHPFQDRRKKRLGPGAAQGAKEA